MSDEKSLKTIATVVYALHVAGFFTGIAWIVAIVMNYVKLDDARGTWLESHFRWQIRTFWYGVLWCSLCALFVVMTFGIGLIFVWIPLGIMALWFIYRIVRGWMALHNRRPMYA